MSDQAITNVTELLAAANETGNHTIAAGTYLLTGNLTVSGDWQSLTPLGNVIIDGVNARRIEFINKVGVIGDTSGTYTVTLQNSSGSVDLNNINAPFTGSFYHTIATGNAENGFRVTGGYGFPGTEVDFYNCKAYTNGLDGFNVHDDGGVSTSEQSIMRLYNCEAYDHIGATDDGATSHEECKLYIYGGSYHDNSHGLHSVNDSHTYLDGSTEWGDISIEDNVIVNIDIGGTGNPILEIRGNLKTKATTDIFCINLENSASIKITQADIDFTGTLGNGIRLNTTGNIDIEFSSFHDVTLGSNKSVIYSFNASATGSIDHNTFYNNDIHLRLDTGIVPGFTFRDNIMSIDSKNAIFNAGVNYTTQMTANHNLFHASTGNLSGDGSLDATDIDYLGTLASLFTDAPNSDFSLPVGSPAIGTGTDGTNIGAWQSSGDLNDAFGGDLNDAFGGDLNDAYSPITEINDQFGDNRNDMFSD